MHGNEKVKPSIADPSLLLATIIKYDNPIAKIDEKINEYPIRCTDNDCWKIVIKNIRENINGKKICFASLEDFIKV